MLYIENEKRLNSEGEEQRAYKLDNEIRETYLQLSPASFLDISLGRQIVAWGKGNILTVNDVINARDNREFGSLDLESMRLASTMAKVDLYYKNWSLSSMYIPEHRTNKNPRLGDNFYPSEFDSLDETASSEKERRTQYALSLNGSLGPVDISFYKSSLLSKDPIVLATDEIVFSDGDNIATGFESFYKKIEHEGASVNYTSGKFSVGGDFARISNLYNLNSPTPYESYDFLSSLEYRRTDNSLEF